MHFLHSNITILDLCFDWRPNIRIVFARSSSFSIHHERRGRTFQIDRRASYDSYKYLMAIVFKKRVLEPRPLN